MLLLFFSLNAFEWKIRFFVRVMMCFFPSSSSSFVIFVILTLCVVIQLISFAISGMIENPKQIDAHLKLFSIYYYVRAWVCVCMCFRRDRLHLSIKSSYKIYLNRIAYVTQTQTHAHNEMTFCFCFDVIQLIDIIFTSYGRSVGRSFLCVHTKNLFVAVDFRAKCAIRISRREMYRLAARISSPCFFFHAI